MGRPRKICAHRAAGIDERTKDGSCALCRRERATAWAAANRERSREIKRTWRQQNPAKDTQSKQDWKGRNPVATREQGRKDHRRRQGIVWAVGQSVETLLVEQNGLCAGGCGRCFYVLNPRFMHVDHDHTLVGVPNVGGLLCFWCNTAGGKLNDDPDALYALGDYYKARGQRLENRL